MAAISRNDPCPCGSGKKHKHCCEGAPDPRTRRKKRVLPVTFIVLGLVLAVVVGLRVSATSGIAVAIAGAIFGLLAWAFQDPATPAGRAAPKAAGSGK